MGKGAIIPADGGRRVSWGSRGSAACCTASTRVARPGSGCACSAATSRPAARRRCSAPRARLRRRRKRPGLRSSPTRWADEERGGWGTVRGIAEESGTRDRPLGLRGDARLSRRALEARRPGRALRPPAADAAFSLARDRCVGRRQGRPRTGGGRPGRGGPSPRRRASPHLRDRPSAFREGRAADHCRRRFRCRSSTPPRRLGRRSWP